MLIGLAALAVGLFGLSAALSGILCCRSERVIFPTLFPYRSFTPGCDCQSPSDRDAAFEPKLTPEHRRLAGFDDKILALYAQGMTTRDIREVVQQLDGVEVSPAPISEVTADLDTEVAAWGTRSPDAIWPIASFDGSAARVRGANGRVLATYRPRGVRGPPPRS